MMYDGYGWGWTWIMFMPLLWIVLVAAVVWAVVRLARPGDAGPRRPGRQASAQEILERRFARGEIDLETFETMRARLSGQGTRSP